MVKGNLKYIMLLVVLSVIIFLGLHLYFSMDEKYLNRARLCWTQKRYDDAILIVEKLIKKNPDNIEAHIILAASFSSKMGNESGGTPEKSLKACNKYMGLWLDEYEKVLSIATKDKWNKKNVESAQISWSNLRGALDGLNSFYQAMLDHFLNSQYTTEIQQLQSDYKRLGNLIEKYETYFLKF